MHGERISVERETSGGTSIESILEKERVGVGVKEVDGSTAIERTG